MRNERGIRPAGSTDEVAGEPDEGFLRRWSRRKRGARDPEPGSDDAPAEPAAPDASPGAGSTSEESADAEPAPPSTDADMPPLESLDENSDYSPFMSSEVSPELRRQALRKLFHSAAFNVVDGLDDYDDDFKSFEALGDLVTADMKHMLEVEERRARERVEAALAAESPPDEDGEEGDPADRIASDRANGADAPDEADPPGDSPEPDRA